MKHNCLSQEKKMLHRDCTYKSIPWKGKYFPLKRYLVRLLKSFHFQCIFFECGQSGCAKGQRQVSRWVRKKLHRKAWLTQPRRRKSGRKQESSHHPERFITAHKAEQWGCSTSLFLVGLFCFVVCFVFFNWIHSHQELQYGFPLDRSGCFI